MTWLCRFVRPYIYRNSPTCLFYKFIPISHHENPNIRLRANRAPSFLCLPIIKNNCASTMHLSYTNDKWMFFVHPLHPPTTWEYFVHQLCTHRIPNTKGTFLCTPHIHNHTSYLESPTILDMHFLTHHPWWLDLGSKYISTINHLHNNPSLIC